MRLSAGSNATLGSRSSFSDVAFAGITKRRDHKRVKTGSIECLPHRAAVGGIANQPSAEERI